MTESSRRLPRLIVVACFGALCSLSHTAFSASDNATTVRNTVLRNAPDQTSGIVAEVPAATALDVFERQRLWVKVSPSGVDGDKAGWLRFTELRFGDDSPAAANTKTAPVESGGFAGFSRSVSGFLRGFRGRAPQSTTTSTIGIRGLTSGELVAANPDPQALKTIGAYAMSKTDAEKFAAAGGLRARRVSEMEETNDSIFDPRANHAAPIRARRTGVCCCIRFRRVDRCS